MTRTTARDPSMLKPSELRAEIAGILASALLRFVVPSFTVRSGSPGCRASEEESESAENALEECALSMAPCPPFTHERQETAR